MFVRIIDIKLQEFKFLLEREGADIMQGSRHHDFALLFRRQTEFLGNAQADIRDPLVMVVYGRAYQINDVGQA